MFNKGAIFLHRKNSYYKAGFCVINADISNLAVHMDILHQEEMTYYNTLTFPKRQLSYLLGRMAAKNAVSVLLHKNIPISSVAIPSGVFNFPVVKHTNPHNIQVSISHCETIGMALAFPEEHPLGIDIEKIAQDKVSAMETVICEEELELLEIQSLAPAVGSTLIWTIKESLSKILKTGLMIDFKMLKIDSIEKKEFIYISTFEHFPQYKAISYQINHYICSVVLPKNTRCDIMPLWNVLRQSITEVPKDNLPSD